MALITGSDCSLDLGGKVFDTVINGFELTFDSETLTYDTLAGPRAAGGSESGELSITFAYDAAEANSLFDDLWTQAGTIVSYVATVGGATFTGNAIAIRPSAPAKAGEISEVSVTLPLDGMPTKGTVPAAKSSSGTTNP